MGYEGKGNPHCNWFARKEPQSHVKKVGRLGNQMTCRNHPNYCNSKIGEDTEKCLFGLRRFAIIQNLVKNKLFCEKLTISNIMIKNII